MNKKIQKMLVVLWGLAITISRVVYFCLAKQTMTDTYEYYANAMIQSGKKQQIFSLGLDYIYTSSLSGLLRFTGNRIEAVGICQMVLQILWLLLFLAGACMIFGKLAGIVAAGMMSASLWILESVFTVSPENFYMLCWAGALLLLGFSLGKTREEEKSGMGKTLCLLAAGFLTGIVTLWHYLGLYLLVLAAYILVRERHAVKRKFIFPIGVIAGCFTAFIHIAAATGKSFMAQIDGWILELMELPSQYLYEEAELESWLFCALAAGILCRNLGVLIWKNKKPEQEETTEKETAALKEQPVLKETTDNYFIAEDGRKVKFLDNPLPVPKKHVKREMGFAIEDVKGDFDINDDFDFKISANDDFDI